MGAILIKPASIAGAVPYSNALTAKPIYLNQPATQRVMKTVTTQFIFGSVPGYEVDMSTTSGQIPLEHVAGMYVDNSQNSHDINIIFLDTGFTARIAFGAQKMIPVITNIKNPKFYVMIDDNGANGLATDITTIQVLNQYVPEYSSEDFANVLTYGYSGVNGVIELQPAFTQSQSFPFSFLVEEPITNINPVISCSQFYLTAVDISFTGGTLPSAGTIENYYITINEIATSNIILQEALTTTPVSNTYKLISLSGLQYISSEKVNNGINFSIIGADINGNPDTNIFGQLSGNFFGGILK